MRKLVVMAILGYFWKKFQTSRADAKYPATGPTRRRS